MSRWAGFDAQMWKVHANRCGQYGNEPGLAIHYSSAALVIEIPPFHKRLSNDEAGTTLAGVEGGVTSAGALKRMSMAVMIL